MRTIFMMDTTAEKNIDSEQRKKLEETRDKAVLSFSDYLREDYFPRNESYSKHALLGPVGKLLAVFASGRIETAEALLGYVVNVHNNTANTATQNLPPRALQRLQDGIKALIELKSGMPKRGWLKLASDLDYAIYFNKYAQVAELKAAKLENSKHSEQASGDANEIQEVGLNSTERIEESLDQ